MTRTKDVEWRYLVPTEGYKTLIFVSCMVKLGVPLFTSDHTTLSVTSPADYSNDQIEKALLDGDKDVNVRPLSLDELAKTGVVKWLFHEQMKGISGVFHGIVAVDENGDISINKTFPLEPRNSHVKEPVLSLCLPKFGEEFRSLLVRSGDIDEKSSVVLELMVAFNSSGVLLTGPLVGNNLDSLPEYSKNLEMGYCDKEGFEEFVLARSRNNSSWFQLPSGSEHVSARLSKGISLAILACSLIGPIRAADQYTDVGRLILILPKPGLMKPVVLTMLVETEYRNERRAS